ncbi:MAG TPA: guanylate kinase [Myxococcaceae bacterium]|nr:guanylate kinase [Myxococcaceae bacterium]
MRQPAPRHRGLLLVLSAPSGTGKTTLARRLVSRVARAEFSVSVTTRPRRGGEREGVDYHFVDPRAFQRRIDRGQLLEWAEVHGHFYGTPRGPAERALRSGDMIVFDIDVQGGRSVQRLYPEAVLVFVLPPSLRELERRLRRRGTDGPDTIRRRMLAARAEIEQGLAAYDYVVVNDDFDHALAELEAIVTAERCRRGRGRLAATRLRRG